MLIHKLRFSGSACASPGLRPYISTIGYYSDIFKVFLFTFPVKIIRRAHLHTINWMYVLKIKRMRDYSFLTFSPEVCLINKIIIREYLPVATDLPTLFIFSFASSLSDEKVWMSTTYTILKSTGNLQSQICFNWYLQPMNNRHTISLLALSRSPL